MLTTIEKTVREIAIENPSSVAVFESLGIDYCCGGRQTLGDACARAGVDLDRAANLLEEAARDTGNRDHSDWSRKPLAELIDHIVTRHHGFVRAEIPRNESLLAKVTSKHGPAHPEVVEIQQLFTALAQELSAHLMKEERILFPHIRGLEEAVRSGRAPEPAMFGSMEHPIAVMIAEHDDAGALLERMRELSNGYVPPADACTTFQILYNSLRAFEQDLHRHVHLENNILFPRAVAMEKAA